MQSLQLAHPGPVPPTPAAVPAAAGSQASTLAAPRPEVRAGVRELLTAAPAFERVDPETRREIAHALVRIASAANLLAVEADPETPARRLPHAVAMNAGDELGGTAADRAISTTRGMMAAISFPRFVAELIQGVFRAIVETNETQLRQYVELVRGVSQSLEGFASITGDDDLARRWLAERFPQSYAIEEPDSEDPPGPEDGPAPLRLVTVGARPSDEALRSAVGLEAGGEIPSGGGEAIVPFVRASLARNRQQILATMVQLGMQRIVVDSGRINAAMRFHIDAQSAAAENRGTSFDTRANIAAGVTGGFWGVSASATIGYVSTTDLRTQEDLSASADLNSSVELHFRTDQLPLDRIASGQTVERLRLNTLSPERELEIARQTDEDRLAKRADIEKARALRPRPAPAPAAPPPPPMTPAGIVLAPPSPALDAKTTNEPSPLAPETTKTNAPPPPPETTKTNAPPPPPGTTKANAPPPPAPETTKTNALRASGRLTT